MMVSFPSLSSSENFAPQCQAQFHACPSQKYMAPNRLTLPGDGQNTHSARRPALTRLLIIVRLVAEHLFFHRDAEDLLHHISVNIRQTKVTALVFIDVCDQWSS